MLRNLLLLTLAGAFCLVLLEVGGRVAVGTPPGQRTLLFSQAPWQWDERGFVRFAPRATIRTAAVYDGAIEYDVRFVTNADGFIDERDYAPAPGLRTLAVLGDSFTAGYHGGEAWVPTLRQAPGFDPERDRLLNLGVSGTGLLNFEKILEAYDPAFGFAEILLVVIRSDFDRPLWRPIAHAGHIFQCEWTQPLADCPRPPSRMLTFDIGVPSEGIRQRVIEVHGTADAAPWRRFKDTSFLLGAIRELRNRAHADLGPGFEALARMRERHPDARIQLLHLPQKREIVTGRFEPLRGPVEAAGVAYLDGWKTCGLELDDFYPVDAHPNSSGYAKIRACAARALGGR